MLTIRPVDVADIIDLCCETSASSGGKPRDWAEFCRSRGLLSFAVLDGETLVGLAIAESTSRLVHVTYLEGNKAACRLLLRRLVLLAGERDVSVSCPSRRTYLRRLLERKGFDLLYEEDGPGKKACLYGREQQ